MVANINIGVERSLLPDQYAYVPALLLVMSTCAYAELTKDLKPYTLKMPIGMIEELKALALETDSDVSKIIRRSVSNFLQEKASA